MYKTEPETSAGGVVWRRRGQKTQIILIRRANNRVWCLPKGKIEAGETKEQAALREVREETGAQAEIEDALGEIHYEYIDNKRRLRLNKTVFFFLMSCAGGNAGTDLSGSESAFWADIDTAREKAAYAGEKDIIGKAKAKLLPEADW